MKEYSQCWAMLMERGWGRLGARGFEMSGKGDLSGSIGCSSVVAILFACCCHIVRKSWTPSPFLPSTLPR